jgi:hypothetical protein
MAGSVERAGAVSGSNGGGDGVWWWQKGRGTSWAPECSPQASSAPYMPLEAVVAEAIYFGDYDAASSPRQESTAQHSTAEAQAS